MSVRWRRTPGTARRACRPVVVAVALLAPLACGDGPAGPGPDDGNGPRAQLLFLSARSGGAPVFGRPTMDLFRMDDDGSGVENLTRAPGEYYHLSQSPDGRRLAFARDGDVWALDLATAALTRLTNRDGGRTEGANGWPRWSPDGSMIAFASNRDGRMVDRVGGLYDVWVMRADGSAARKVSGALVDTVGLPATVVGWSPGGQVVLESSGFKNGVEHRGVHVVNPDGTGLRRLFERPGDHSPAWSPDGARIAFISDRDGPSRLYVMNADGSGARALTAHAGDDRLPMGYGTFTTTMVEYDPWSPDGRMIAFERFGGEEWGSVWVTGADGSGLRRLAESGSMFNGWSPDGRRIAFSMGVNAGPRDVYVVGADGTGRRNLTDDPAEDSGAMWVRRR